MTLVYYRIERDKLINTKYDQIITTIEAIGLTYLLSKRFNVPVPKIIINDRKINKFRQPNTIIYIKTHLISGDVSHEFAHYLQYVKTGKTRHDKRMLSYTRRTQKFVDGFI